MVAMTDTEIYSMEMESVVQSRTSLLKTCRTGLPEKPKYKRINKKKEIAAN